MLQIRTAKEDDIDTIIRIAKETWPVAYGDILSADQLAYMLDKFYSPESLEEQMTVRQHQFIVVEFPDSEIIGFASFGKNSRNAYHLHKLYVMPSAQGKKAGQKMIDFIVQQITEKGAEALLLNVNRHNPAIGFYERMGFRIIREEDIDIGNGFYMNDFVMELRFR